MSSGNVKPDWYVVEPMQGVIHKTSHKTKAVEFIKGLMGSPPQMKHKSAGVYLAIYPEKTLKIMIEPEAYREGLLNV